MMVSIQGTLQLLLVDSSGVYGAALSEILRDKWQNVDITQIKTLQSLETILKSASWSAVIVAYEVAQRVMTVLQDSDSSVPLFVVCDAIDEDDAFELMEQGARGIVPLEALRRFPLLLQREQERRVLEQHYQASLNNTALSALQEPLRRSEIRFRSVIEGFNDVILIVDSFHIIRYANTALQRQFGYSMGDVLGRPFRIFLNAHEEDIVEVALESILENPDSTQTFEHQLLRADGAWEIVETTAQSNIDPAGQQTLLVHIHCITQRKQAEKALRASEQRFQTMADTAPAMIWVTDMTGASTFLSRGWSEFTGQEGDAALGYGWLDMLHPEDRDRTKAEFAAAMTLRESFQIDYRLQHIEGGYRWAVDSGRPNYSSVGEFIGYIGSVIDIHERKTTEKELKALYNATSHLFKADSVLNMGQQIVETVVREFDQADCGLMLIDKQQGQIIRLARTGQYNIRPDAPLTLDGWGLVPLAIRTGRTVYVPDVSLDMLYVPNELQTRSELVIPLKTANGVIAVLDLQRSEVDAFSEHDQRILTAYAERAAVAIENMQLYEQINLHNTDLEMRVDQRTAQLNDAKERVEAILNNSPDGILLTNLNLSIQQTNFAFDRMFMSEPDAFFDEPLMNLIHADDTALVLKTTQLVIAQRKGKNIEVQAQRKDGSNFHVELSIGYVGVANTQEAGLVCIIHDITARKRAEQALEESHRFTQRITETAPNIIYLLDLETAETIYINRNLPALMGYSEDDPNLNRNPLRKLMHPEDAAKLEIYLSQIRASSEDTIWQFEYRLSHRKKGWQWFLSRDTVFRRNDNGTVGHILGTATDITERKRIEEALREGEEKFRLLVEAAPVAIVITDQAGKITLINIQGENLFGYKREDLMGQPVELLLAESKRTEHVEQRMSYTQMPHIRQMGAGRELFAQQRDGTQIPVEVQLSSIETQTGLLVMAFVVDITERKERERQLRYHASLQENVTDAVIATDLNFHIQSWNLAAERIYGWAKEDVLGKHVSEVLGTQFPPSASFNMIEHQFLTDGHWTDEVTQYHRNGTPISILSSVVLFKDEQDRSLGVVAVNHDITSRKQAEQALHQALAHEKELSELKSRFVMMASHEFRTPLASILAITETLTAYRQKLSPERIDQKLGNIRDQVDYLKEIMEDVLLLGRMQANHVELVPVLLDFPSLCQSVIDEIKTHLNFSHHLIYTVHGDVRDVHVDKKLMRRVISNLVTNAIKYSPQTETIHVTLTIDEDELVLAVKDHGIGIPKADLKHLFQPFHRATNVGTISGTGLGLVLTREAVELHGGTITAESDLGVGTTFTVNIPVDGVERA